MLSKTERPNHDGPSLSGPMSCTIRRFCTRLSGPQKLGLGQLIWTLQTAPFFGGIGQARMGLGFGAASAVAQRRRFQWSDMTSSPGTAQGMKKLFPSAIVNSNRGEVPVHSEPLADSCTRYLRRS